jgi:hypothetical protein
MVAACLATATVARADDCAGVTDLTCDGQTDVADIAVVANPKNFQQATPADPRTDINGDNVVDIKDIYEISRVMGCRYKNPPTPRTALTVSGTVGEVVEFDGSLSSGEESLELFAWDFGDSTGVEGADIDYTTHVYDQAGDYLAELRIQDWCGAESTVQIDVAIADDPGQDPDPITADFDASVDVGEIGVPVTFSAHAPEDQVLAYLWSFSDGGGAYGQTVAHTFAQGGDFTVRLLVITADGQSLEKTTGFPVSPGLSVAGVVWEGPLNMPRGFAHVKSVDSTSAMQDIVWAAGDPVALATANVSDPNAPSLLAETSVPGGPWDLAANDSVVAVAATWAGVSLFDATQPDNLTPIAQIDTVDIDATYAFDVALSEDLLFVASGVNLMVFDVSDPTDPELRLATRDLSALQVEVLNGYLFAYGGGYAGYRIYDFSGFHSADSEAELLVEVGAFPTSAMPLDISIDDRHLAVAEGIHGVELFRLPSASESSDGSYQPVPIASRNYVGDGVRGVHLQGDYLYVAQGSRVEKLRITSSDSLQLIQWVGMSSWVYDLRGDGTNLYLGIAHGVTATLQP